MERRSRRSGGKTEVLEKPIARGRPSIKKTPMKTTPIAKAPSPEPEVVLNARGMPARQRKKNRFYYDEETMITPDTMARSKSLKKIKAEPIEVPEDHDVELFTTTQSPSPHSGSPPRTIISARTVPTVRGTVKPRTNATPGTGVLMLKPTAAPLSAPTPSNRGYKGKSLISTPIIPSVEEKRGKQGIKQGARQRPLSEGAPTSPKKRQRAVQFPCDLIPATDATKGLVNVRPIMTTGEGKEEKQKPKVDIRKKLKVAAKGTEDSEPSKKPKMQFIRIKREPDMSLGTPEHVTTLEYEQGYRQRERRASEKNRREDSETRKTTARIDERLLKEDYSDDLAHSTIVRSHYAQGTSLPGSSKAATKAEPEQRVGLDKKTAHDISIRLRNLLKLPKAHKWVCYEWFYSNIDKVLFEGENDFQICLKESFPQLKVRKMARAQWCKVRRLMGKPRRCSQSFFDEEREELMRRRQKIRMIQQRKLTDFNYKELPDEIPLQLVIGTKVTSRLRKPQDGLFTGTIDGVDTSNNTYRITFDRPGLGTHSIPDYEVLSNDPPETVSISTFALKIPRRNFSFGGFKCRNPLLMGEEVPGLPKSPFPVDGMLGGFPVRLLDMIVRLSKLLKGKREKIIHLKELNVEAEKLRSYGKNFNEDFRLRYARVVVDLESMNKQMSLYLDGIQQYCLEIAQDHCSFQMVIPEHVQESCRQEASLLVDTFNTNKNRNMVHGNKTLQLIADMASLLLQVKVLSSGDRNVYELKSIKDTMSDMKATLGGKNLQIFQDRVEIPMNRIQAGLTLTAHK